ncbi:MAG: GGDEF domain-containing phosphodiesterase [Pseudomonadota bacterium]
MVSQSGDKPQRRALRREKVSVRWRLQRSVASPIVAAIVPVMLLLSYWLGGETALLLVGLAMSFCALIIALREGAARRVPTTPRNRAEFCGLLDLIVSKTADEGQLAACLVVGVDDLDALTERVGRQNADEALALVADRLQATVKETDALVRLGRATFAICAQPTDRLTLERGIALAERLQTVVRQPIDAAGTRLYLQASIGICMSNDIPDGSGESWLAAAEAALTEAERNGPEASRVYDPALAARAVSRQTLNHNLADEIEDALLSGDVRPWFQPQVDAVRGTITGFEALARWHHPIQGSISPREFLPLIENAGMGGLLSDRILHHGLKALRAWGDAGYLVPTLGVNFGTDELRDPKLLDKVRWELDRFDLTPERLAIEVLEHVIATSDEDMITRNVRGLAAMGCVIDLDDFGTGHSSISAIRRFAVGRLKIDRSFVAKIDRDADQQKMVRAVLTMAEQLDLETLAEGIETHGEHALLAEMGCHHVQGFGIARPMPFEDTLQWLAQRTAAAKRKASAPAEILSRIGQAAE